MIITTSITKNVDGTVTVRASSDANESQVESPVYTSDLAPGADILPVITRAVSDVYNFFGGVHDHRP